MRWLLALTILLVGCTPAEIQQTKDTARTVNDAARIACEAAFGEDLPQGLTVEDLCRAREDIDPFVRAILGAKQTVGAAHGVAVEE